MSLCSSLAFVATRPSLSTTVPSATWTFSTITFTVDSRQSATTSANALRTEAWSRCSGLAERNPAIRSSQRRTSPLDSELRSINSRS